MAEEQNRPQRRWVFESYQDNQKLSRTIDLFEEFEGCGQRQIPLGLNIAQRYYEATSHAQQSATTSLQEDRKRIAKGEEPKKETKKLLGQAHDNWISHRMWLHRVRSKLEKYGHMMFPTEREGYKNELKTMENINQSLGQKTSDDPSLQGIYDLAWFINAMPYSKDAIELNLPVSEDHMPAKENSVATSVCEVDDAEL